MTLCGPPLQSQGDRPAEKKGHLCPRVVRGGTPARAGRADHTDGHKTQEKALQRALQSDRGGALKRASRLP